MTTRGVMWLDHSLAPTLTAPSGTTAPEGTAATEQGGEEKGEQGVAGAAQEPSSRSCGCSCRRSDCQKRQGTAEPVGEAVTPKRAVEAGSGDTDSDSESEDSVEESKSARPAVYSSPPDVEPIPLEPETDPPAAEPDWIAGELNSPGVRPYGT